MRSLAELEDVLSEPRDGLIADLDQVPGDIIVLGAGGKLGPSLVRLAVRATQAAGSGRRVLAVSRFGGSPEVAEGLGRAGAVVIPADIAADGVLDSLPDVPNVIFLVGAKFGTSDRAHATWHTNTFLPGLVARRYRDSRIIALSTGNVYPLTPVEHGGATEDTVPDPVGEYAMSCLGRERIFGYFASRYGTPMALVRLNYAVEMRYGVLVDIARSLHRGDPIDVSMGHVNVVWQRYANEAILRCLPRATDPPFVLNVTGPELVRVRQVACWLADQMGITPRFTGTESPTALLSDAGRCHQLFGYPDLTLRQLVELTAAWVGAGLPVLDKPTGYQRRDGRF